MHCVHCNVLPEASVWLFCAVTVPSSPHGSPIVMIILLWFSRWMAICPSSISNRQKVLLRVHIANNNLGLFLEIIWQNCTSFRFMHQWNRSIECGIEVLTRPIVYWALIFQTIVVTSPKVLALRNVYITISQPSYFTATILMIIQHYIQLLTALFCISSRICLLLIFLQFISNNKFAESPFIGQLTCCPTFVAHPIIILRF